MSDVCDWCSGELSLGALEPVGPKGVVEVAGELVKVVECVMAVRSRDGDEAFARRLAIAAEVARWVEAVAVGESGGCAAIVAAVAGSTHARSPSKVGQARVGPV